MEATDKVYVSTVVVMIMESIIHVDSRQSSSTRVIILDLVIILESSRHS